MCMYDERANDNRVYRHILALTSSLLEPPLFALLGAPVALLAVMTALHINKLTFQKTSTSKKMYTTYRNWYQIHIETKH